MTLVGDVVTIVVIAVVAIGAGILAPGMFAAAVLIAGAFAVLLVLAPDWSVDRRFCGVRLRTRKQTFDASEGQ